MGPCQRIAREEERDEMDSDSPHSGPYRDYVLEEQGLVSRENLDCCTGRAGMGQILKPSSDPI